MDEQKIEAMRAAVNRGIAAANQGQRDSAHRLFEQGLDLAEQIADTKTRRDEMAVLSTLLERGGFADLALQSAEEAVDLDYELDLPKRTLAQDLIAVGNAHLQLENTAQAEDLYQQALDMLLEVGDWANAASATTNIATVVANGGDMPRAIEMLEESLRYLEKESFDDTEMNTRMTLLQAYEIEAVEPSRAAENAQKLVSKFWSTMRGQHRQVATQFIEQLSERHPEDSSAWRAATFPAIYA